MKNFVGAGDQITLTAGADIDGGKGYVVGSIFGVAISSVKSGQLYALQRTGIITLPKATGANTDIAVGARLWWDDANKRVAKAAATGFFQIGAAVTAATTTGATVQVVLDGIATVAAA